MAERTMASALPAEWYQSVTERGGTRPPASKPATCLIPDFRERAPKV